MKFKGILLSIPFILTLCGCSSLKTLDIRILNVGKADCSIIIHDDKVSIIDAAESSNGAYICKYLTDLRVKKIESFIITHFDKDHVGGASRILTNFDVEKIYVPNYVETSVEYNSFINAVNAKNYSLTVVNENSNINICGLNATIYPSPKANKSSNNLSLVTKITKNKMDFLFTGDIMDYRMRDMINKEEYQSEFLKVPYHGHYQDAMKGFLQTIKPKYAAICCSNAEKEDQNVMNLLDEINTKTFLTREGDIKLTSDGNKISMKYE